MAAAPLEPSLPGALLFWRWLSTALLVSALAAFVAQQGVSLAGGGAIPLSWQAGTPAPAGGLKFLPEASFDTAIVVDVSPPPPFVYALVFFLNVFFLQRFETLAPRRAWSLALLGSAALLGVMIAATLAALLLFVPLLLAGGRLGAWLGTGGGYAGPAVYFTLEMLWGIAGCALMAAVLAQLHRRYASQLWARSPKLARAHLWGGVAGGALLDLQLNDPAGFLKNVSTSTPLIDPALALALLLLAAVPHAAFTYRAMRPALAESASTVTSTGAFFARLCVTVLPLLALALIFAAIR